MKVYCNIDVDKRSFEGRTQLSGKVVRDLRDQGYIFTNNPAEADIFHFHSSGVFDSYRAYKLQQQYRKPCLYSLYSNVQEHPIMFPYNFLLQRLFMQKTATKFLPSYSAVFPLSWRSIFLRKLTHVIVPSRYLHTSFRKNGKMIRFGVDTTKFKPLVKEASVGSKIKVAYFGHSSTFKGLNDFVNASRHFDDHIEAHVFVTQRFAKVDRYITKRNPRIIIHGFVENIVEAYNEMDIIVLPYRMQIGTVANPLVLLEAMACGKAIVTTDFEFVREMVEDAAVMVPKYRPKIVARAVNKLALDPEQRKILGMKARERAVQHYGLQRMLQQYGALYGELAAKMERHHE